MSRPRYTAIDSRGVDLLAEIEVKPEIKRKPECRLYFASNEWVREPVTEGEAPVKFRLMPGGKCEVVLGPPMEGPAEPSGKMFTTCAAFVDLPPIPPGTDWAVVFLKNGAAGLIWADSGVRPRDSR
jgi:hypothetical protein